MINTYGSLTYAERCELEVEWYEKHGNYKTRIKTDSLGVKYVEGDWQWHRAHPHAVERINQQLAEYVAWKKTGIKR